MNCKKTIVFLFTIFIFSNLLKSQNIYDSTNTLNYAKFLYSSHEYKLASEEFDRLLFITKNNNDTLKYFSVKAKRLSGNIDEAYSKIITFYPNDVFNSNLLSTEYIKILINKKDYSFANSEIPKLKTLDSNEKVFFMATTELLLGNYDKGRAIINNNINNLYLEPFKPILLEQSKIRRKNPYLASGLSVIIPGLGQTYSGNWKDGIFAFIISGSSIFQTYRNFSKYGTSNAYSWITSAIAAAFYTANIYGAAKASNKYNYLKNIKISIQIETVFNNHF